MPRFLPDVPRALIAAALLPLVLPAPAAGAPPAGWASRCPVTAAKEEPLRCPAADSAAAPSEDDPAYRCLLCSLYRCRPASGTVWLDQGSLRLEILGPRAGACGFRLEAEVEQGIRRWSCQAQAPVVPWAGLLGRDPLAGAPAAVARACTLTAPPNRP